MEILKRIVGVVLLAIGAVVAGHTIIEPLYHVSSAASPYSPMWRIIDPLQALAIVLGVICGYIRKRSVARDGEAPITRECLAANALFYPVRGRSRGSGCGRRYADNRGGSGSAPRPPGRRCATPCASGGS